MLSNLLYLVIIWRVWASKIMFKSYCYMMLKMFVAKESVMPITKVIFVQRNIYQENLY